ncbi:MAG: TRAM domain-containing protein, partial [Flavobacteriaceae bacterium]
MARKRIDKVVHKLEVRDINTKGMGVAKSDEGQIYFIKNSIPGDIVDVRVLKKKRGYFEAEPIKWIQSSKDRRTPQCEHFGVCGGCKWQHLAYETQLHYKEKGVLQNLKSIGKVIPETILPIKGVDHPYFYRNKMEFSFSNNRWLTTEEIKESGEVERNGLGFHKPQMWDKIVDISKCHLQADPSNEIRNEIKAFALKHQMAFFNARTQEGFLRSLMIKNTLGGEIMVLLQFFEDRPKEITLLLNFIKDRFPAVNALLYCINQKSNDTLYDQEIQCFHGSEYITEN